MSWGDLLKQIKKNLLSGDEAIEQIARTGRFTDHTVEQLRAFLNRDARDIVELEELLTEIEYRERERKEGGKDVLPALYSLRLELVERIKARREEDWEKFHNSAKERSDREEHAEDDGREEAAGNREDIPKVEDVIQQTPIVPPLKRIEKRINLKRVIPHPSEEYIDVQHPENQDGVSGMEVRIGLDFGTAFTKVVLGTPLGAYAAPIANSHNDGHDFLLPGILSIDESGVCHLGEAEGCVLIDDLKMRIIDSGGELSLDHQANVVAFLALLFRKIRWWWLIQGGEPEEFRKSRITWFVNAGLPTETSSGVVADLYRHLVLAAWAISTDKGVITVAWAREIAELTAEDVSIVTYDQEYYLKGDSLELMPEFLAQTAVYINHPTVDKLRLHALVDIGAGTVDATIFNVYDWNDVVRHAVYGKSVLPMGASYLFQNRISKLSIDTVLERGYYMQEHSDHEFAIKLGVGVGEIASADHEFLSQFIEGIVSMRRRVYKDLNSPNDKNLLDKGIRLFLSGGGARLNAYSHRVRELEEASQNGSARNSIEVVQLPKLGDTEERERKFIAPGLSVADYDRMSVAYGLSDDSWNLADLLGEAAVKRINAETREQGRRSNRGNISDTGGSFWDDPNAPPVW